ncbi:hypothetical protein L1887_58573 [Cichorium endivia]|nr:hypothetical protein L1887_58573 [Cichorium endivia]
MRSEVVLSLDESVRTTTHLVRSEVRMSLACHHPCARVHVEFRPFGLKVSSCKRTVRLGQAIHVDGVQIQTLILASRLAVGAEAATATLTRRSSFRASGWLVSPICTVGATAVVRDAVVTSASQITLLSTLRMVWWVARDAVTAQGKRPAARVEHGQHPQVHAVLRDVRLERVGHCSKCDGLLLILRRVDELPPSLGLPQWAWTTDGACRSAPSRRAATRPSHGSRNCSYASSASCPPESLLITTVMPGPGFSGTRCLNSWSARMMVLPECSSTYATSLGRIADVDRRDDTARSRDTVVGIGNQRRVGRDDRHPITGLEPWHGAQRKGERERTCGPLLVGEAVAALGVGDGELARCDERCAQQERHWRQRRAVVRRARMRRERQFERNRRGRLRRTRRRIRHGCSANGSKKRMDVVGCRRNEPLGQRRVFKCQRWDEMRLTGYSCGLDGMGKLTSRAKLTRSTYFGSSEQGSPHVEMWGTGAHELMPTCSHSSGFTCPSPPTPNIATFRLSGRSEPCSSVRMSLKPRRKGCCDKANSPLRADEPGGSNKVLGCHI